MSKRKRDGLSKKLRFEVFKRDRFTCQYCGKKAPDVVLNVDHIKAVATGGDDGIMNLITSCFDCNSGKSDQPLGENVVLEKQRQQLEQLEERRQQLDMMLEWQRSLMSLDNEACDKLAELWSEIAVGWHLNDTGRASLQKLIRKFGAAEVANAMREATGMYLQIEGEPAKATADSVNKSWEYVGRICGFKKTMEDKPYMRDLFYIRGIVRRRFASCRDWLAMKVLRESYELGATIEELKAIALEASSWTAWQNQTFDAGERARQA